MRSSTAGCGGWPATPRSRDSWWRPGDVHQHTGATIHKTGSGTANIDGSARLTNFATIDVGEGALSIASPAYLGGTTYQVAAGATLTINSADGVTQWQGAHDVTGGGTVTVGGEVDSIGMDWAFGPSEALFVGSAIDTNNGGFGVTGTFSIAGGMTIRGDSFAVTTTGTLIQPVSSGVTLDPGADVANLGVWRMAGNTTIQGTAGGDLETFTNHTGATIHKTGSGTANIDGSARLTNFATIDVGEGALSIASPAYLGGTTYQVAAGATLTINSADGVTQWQGAHDVTGGGTVTVGGEVDSIGMDWAFGPSEALFVGSAIDTNNGGFGVTGTFSIAGGMTIRGDSFAVTTTGTLIQPVSSGVTLDPGADVANLGVWRMAGNTTIQGTAGGDLETFTNHTGATIHKTGSGTANIDGSARLTNFATIDVGEGALSIASPAYLGGTTYQVAAGATLTINSADGVTQWQGAHDVTGGGTVTVGGEVDSIGMDWAFGPSEALFVGSAIDTNNGGFGVTGTFSIAGGMTIRGDSFAVTTTGTLIQPVSSGVTLDPGADVANLGVWRMAGNTTIQGTAGGDLETFTNHTGATIHKTGSGTANIDGSARLTNLGTVHAAGGSLGIGNLEQISDNTLTGGTYFADDAQITLPSNVTMIGFAAAVHLGGTGTMPQVDGLTSNTGTLWLSGGKDFTTTASFDNSGVAITGPGSTLAVNGTFTNSGTYWTEIAGTPASGLFGFLSATGAATLGGTFAVTTDAAFTPVFGDAYDVVRYTSRSGAFDVHEGIDPFYRRAYDPGATTLLRLSVGQGPVASAGGPYLLDEGGPAVQLDSSLSADPDGTIASYAWTPATGLNNPASPTPSLTPPNDNTTYDITLTVTDDDALVDSDTATVTVQNVPPVITGVTLPATANEGSPVNLQVTFTDQGTADTHVAFINWGDTTAHSDAATSPLELQHTYTAPGNYTVDVCIQDDDLGQVCTERGITITNVNVPPQITPIGTPYHGSEGDSVFANYDLVDPDGPNPLTYSWSVPVGTPATFSDATDPFPTLNTTDDASFSMTLEVCDAGTPAACGTATFPVVLENTAPMITFFSVPATAEVGESITAGYSTFDQGDDTVTVTFDWGDGTQPGTSPTHTYTAQGTYTVTACPSDGAVTGTCATDMITVGGGGENQAPTAEDDVAAVATGTGATSVAVRNNDSDPDGDPFTVTAFQTPSAQGGTVTCTAASCTYTPAAGFTGTDTFTYTITDQPATGLPLSDTATVTVTVGANQPPVAANDTVTVASESGDNTIFVLDNDSDPDPGDSIVISQFQNPSAQGGTVSCSTTPNFGTCSYSPAAGFTGTDSFTYTIEDEVDAHRHRHSDDHGAAQPGARRGGRRLHRRPDDSGSRAQRDVQRLRSRSSKPFRSRRCRTRRTQAAPSRVR